METRGLMDIKLMSSFIINFFWLISINREKIYATPLSKSKLWKDQVNLHTLKNC